MRFFNTAGPVQCEKHYCLPPLTRLDLEETGQVFEPAALDQVWELIEGQPWLVNALGYETCFKMKTGRDRFDRTEDKPWDEKLLFRRSETYQGMPVTVWGM